MKDLKKSLEELNELFKDEFGKKPKSKSWERMKKEILRNLPTEKPIIRKRKKINTYKK